MAMKSLEAFEKELNTDAARTILGLDPAQPQQVKAKHAAADPAGIDALVAGIAVPIVWDKPVNKVKPLDTYTAADMVGMDIQPPPFIVKGILPAGLALLAAPPKVGKSWLALNLAMCISEGKPFLGMDTKQGSALYMDLESAQWRVNERLKVTGGCTSENLAITHNSDDLDHGLMEQLQEWCHRDGIKPRLIIIDTLGKVTGHARRGENAYERDYRLMSMLQRFAMSENISILIVHHLKKQTSFQPGAMMERISGSMGLPGSADVIWLLDRKEGEPEATLHLQGRDFDPFGIVLRFSSNCVWEVVSTDGVAYKAEREYAENPLAKGIKALLSSSDSSIWEGTASDLMDDILERIGLPAGYTPKTVGNDLQKYLQHLNKDGIFITIRKARRHGSKPIRLIHISKNATQLEA